MQKLSLSEWVKTVENKDKKIAIYWKDGTSVTERKNLESFKRYLRDLKVTTGLDYTIHKIFETPESYQVYLNL